MNTTQGINSSDVTVLLVDDNHVNNKLVASILMPQAYNIYVADKGKDGIKMARDLLPDVILLDIMMPEIDGFQVCKHLQDDSLTREIPVIFITADSSVKAQTKAFQMGGSDFITKPIVDVVLIERINNQVRLSRNKKELSTLNNYHDLAETLFHSGFWAFHNVDGIVDSTFSKHLTSILEVHDINTEFQFAPELITVLLSDSKDTITHGEYLARWTQVLTFGGVFDEVCSCTVGSQKKFLRIRAEFVREDANDLAGFGAIQDVTDIIRTENELADLKAKLANSNTRQNLIETNTQLAHELNQPLAAINLNVNYVKQLLNADPLDLSKLKESLADVSSDVTRATNIVKNIRRIVKKEPAFMRQFNLIELLRETVYIFKRELLQQNVTMIFNPTEDSVIVNFDRTSLQQVAVNLIKNALEALATVECADPEIKIEVVRSNSKTNVLISNNGPPLTLQDEERVFQQYYTSKPGNTGLGLSICKSLMSELDGDIRLAEPTGGHTACFNIIIA